MRCFLKTLHIVHVQKQTYFTEQLRFSNTDIFVIFLS